MKKILLILVFIFACSCHKDKRKIIDFDYFSIEVPEKWEKVELKGIDSYVGGISLNNDRDTLFFEFGSSAPKMNEVIGVNSISNYNKLKREGFDLDNIFFSKTPDIDQNQGVFHKEYYYYKAIDSHQAKVKIPKIIGDGLTAISFDSLNLKNDKLYIYCKNLDTINQFNVIKSFNTIKFPKK